MRRTSTIGPPAVRQYVSLADAAEMIGCHPKTLRRLIAAGRLTGYRVGRAIRIDLDELYAALPPIPTVRQGNDR